MPRRSHIRPPSYAFAALLIALAAGVAYGATVRTQALPNYQRVLFDFGGPARMQVAQGDGRVTLTFNRPITGGVNALTAQLKPYVTSAELSPDGTTLSFTTDRAYRVRQFISGNVVGVDLLTSENAAPAPTPPPAPKPEPKPEPKPTPPPEPKPEPKPTTTDAPAPAAIREAPSPVLSTKPQPVPPAVAEAPPVTPEPEEAPIMAASESETNPLLTTKGPEESTAALTTSAPQAPVQTGAIEVPPLGDAKAAPASEEEDTAGVPDEIEPEQAAAETALPTADPAKPFLVSARSDASGTHISFPFGTRTGAAVFERGRDIWIAFSQERDAKTALLAPLLPKSIVRVQQFALPGATVLRLTTDGTTHASASQPEGTYEWAVTLSPRQTQATLDIPISPETESGKRQLLLKAFDVAPPLVFYDPTLGDKLVVMPAYEVGRGISARKEFPELTILPTQQGIAIASQRDDLRVTQDRTGVTVLGDRSLAVSDSLPIYAADATPVPGISASADVSMPYDAWFVGASNFNQEREARLQALATATPAQTADSLMGMVQLYLGRGMAVEALGYLDLLKQQHPDYYRTRKLALLHAACYTMLDRINEARESASSAELEGMDEATMWRDIITVLSPASRSAVDRLQAETEAESAARQQAAADAAVEETGEAPVPEAAPVPPAPATFDFLRYNQSYIRFYPPRVRQKLAVFAADAFTRNNQEEEAIKVYDTLNRDGILAPVQGHAEFTLGSIAAKKNKVKEALDIFDRLASRYTDPFIQTKARFASTMLRYNKGMIDTKAATNELESLRLAWRGDRLQRDILATLAQLYRDNKQYDDTLRTWKYLLESFPNDPESLTIAGDMAAMFEELFLHGMADDMPPLKSLALFYEFRELTPVGERGNDIIQKLADRLAAVDLLDRAAQLLENQIKFRLSGEDRARVGARLALLYLLNKQPNEALGVLEVTNYGDASRDLRRQRIQLTAQALSATGKHEEALSMLFSDDSREADLLRLDVLWAMKDWPNVINQGEDVLSDRADLTSSLTSRETEILMKLALGYTFEGDRIQLRYLRDYYTGLLPEGPYKEIFDFLTNDTAPLDPEDFQLVARQISNTESFLDTFRTQIASGKLSETVK